MNQEEVLETSKRTRRATDDTPATICSKIAFVTDPDKRLRADVRVAHRAVFENTPRSD